MSPSEPNRKLVWLVLWAAFTVAPVLYYVVGMQIAGSVAPGPLLGTLRLPFALAAALAVVAGAFLMTRAPRARAGAQGFGVFLGAEDLAGPAAFQLAFIIATSLVEACSVFGFVLLFLGAPLGEYLPFGAASVAVMLAIALPTGWRYWDEYERVSAGGPPSAG